MRILTTVVLACAFIISTAEFVLAADKKPKGEKKPPTEMTAEQRQKMAEIHEKMATCLKSPKSIEDCHKELAGSYKDAMGKEGCPMHMGHKHGKHGKHHDGEKCDGDCDHDHHGGHGPHGEHDHHGPGEGK